jgi:arsenite transporter
MKLHLNASEQEPARPTLSLIDRYLAVWIIIAIAFGVELNAIGVHVPAAVVPIALIAMMYPRFARVRYEALPALLGDLRQLVAPVVQNWVIAPLVMFALAALLLRSHPDYFVGLVMIGLARCIAMVVVWSELAHADREYTAALAALNSLFQVFAYAAYAWVFVTVLPPLVGLPGLTVHLALGDVVRSVLLYVGLPFVAGALTRALLRPRLGGQRYDDGFGPATTPLGLTALLVTVVAMFALQAGRIKAHPSDVLLIAVPLVISFVVMFCASFWLGRRTSAGYARTTSLALTAASNDFTLAIVVCIAVFGISSGQAFAAVIGQLVEVPVLLALVNVALHLRGRFASANPTTAKDGAIRAGTMRLLGGDGHASPR